MHDASTIPPKLAHPKVERVAAEYRRLTAELRATDQAAADLVAARHRSSEEDLNARAAALRAGKADPGTEASDRIEREILEIDSKAQALRRAVDQVYAELVEVFEAHRADLAERDDVAVGRAREAFAGLVEQMAEAYGAQRRAEAARAWAATFPQRSRWSPAGGAVPGLVAPSGETMSWDVVLDALRRLADPPAPKPAPLYGGQPWVTSGAEAA